MCTPKIGSRASAGANGPEPRASVLDLTRLQNAECMQSQRIRALELVLGLCLFGKRRRLAIAQHQRPVRAGVSRALCDECSTQCRSRQRRVLADAPLTRCSKLIKPASAGRMHHQWRVHLGPRRPQWRAGLGRIRHARLRPSARAVPRACKRLPQVESVPSQRPARSLLTRRLQIVITGSAVTTQRCLYSPPGTL